MKGNLFYNEKITQIRGATLSISLKLKIVSLVFGHILIWL
ncbi:hypothetical protein VDIAB_60013 [Vibrio diabolicus]|nr:hypothetical protein VDIAB_60013 [Vibrio diabolicus]